MNVLLVAPLMFEVLMLVLFRLERLAAQTGDTLEELLVEYRQTVEKYAAADEGRGPPASSVPSRTGAVLFAVRSLFWRLHRHGGNPRSVPTPPLLRGALLPLFSGPLVS